MIQFKQIIGRGTRLYEGKHYFTIIDFVGAWHLFNDPEWDGEPVEPVPVEPRPPGPNDPKPDVPDTPEKPEMVKIKLAEGKERQIQVMSSSMFFMDGRTVSVQEFVKKLYGDLQRPEFFDSEEKLRELWASPITRRELLEKLERAGFSKENLVTLQQLIEPRDSDLFDVLEYINYNRPPISRRDRVSMAESNIYAFLKKEQREFIEFVLDNYIKDGVDELDDEKLGNLITLKYNSTADAERVLGNLDRVRDMFIDFQKHLYLENHPLTRGEAPA